MNQVLKSFNAISSLTNSFKNGKKLSTLINKDLTKNSMLTQNADLLINDLKNARSINTVLELVNTHNKIMNSNHTIAALKAIFMLQKHGNSGISTPNVLKHPDFEKICKQIKHQAGVLDINQTLDALKAITFLGIQSNSTIYQILLQLIKHNMNDMSLQQIMFTDFVISKAQRCPLIDALRIALPIVYDNQLPIKLDRTNINSLPDHLYYVSKSNVSEQSIMTIINTLMKLKVFDSRTSISIIWSLCDMRPRTSFEPLINKAFKSFFIANKGDSISYVDLETTISKLTQRYSAKMSFYYNEAFYDYCANILIGDDLGFEPAVHLLRKFLKVNHMNTNLLNYISEKCHENPDLIENGDPLLTCNIICGCALTSFRPEYFDSMKKSILRIKNYNNFADQDYLLRFQTALSVLDIYIPDILQMALNENYLKQLFKRNFMIDFDNVLLVSQAVKTLRPEFINYLPNDDFLNFVKSKIRTVRDRSIEGIVNYLFGGTNFVKTPACTKMLHHIDHLVVLRKGGIPCPLNPTDVYIEDIQCDLPSQIVLVISLKNFQYTINNRQQLGTTNLMLQTLEAKGYSIVPICLTLWKNMPEVERIPYIVEAIKSKTELYDKIYDMT